MIHTKRKTVFEGKGLTIETPVLGSRYFDKFQDERNKDRSGICRTDFQRDYETATSVGETFIVSPIVLSFRYGKGGRHIEDKDRGKPVRELSALSSSCTGILSISSNRLIRNL